MATYDKGILGAFTGTVGTVVGSSWRGKNIMRSRPKKTTRTPSEAQNLQRERFTVVTHFLTPIRDLYNRYFGQNVGARSRYNVATSYHIKEAVEWANEQFEIRYSKVMISKGELQGMQDPRATPEGSNRVKINWTDNSGQGMALPTDTLLVVFYSPVLNLFEVFENQAERADTEVFIDVAAYFTGTDVHCWASFVSDQRKQSASSSYLGEISIS